MSDLDTLKKELQSVLKGLTELADAHVQAKKKGDTEEMEKVETETEPLRKRYKELEREILAKEREGGRNE